MAAIARFGFENGQVPTNVSIVMAAATGSAFVPGRNGGTCCEAKNEPEYGSNYNAYVEVAFTPVNTIYFSCQLKVVQDNYNEEFALFTFSTMTVRYNRATGQLRFFNGGTHLYTSGVVNFPSGVWIPVNGKFVSSATDGEITITVDGMATSVTPVNTGGASSGTFQISLGSSRTADVYQVYFTGHYGPPKFQVDDIAVNDSLTANNSSGSFGASDNVIPAYISCRSMKYATTGSNTSGWTSPSGDIVADITSTGSGYITSSFLPRPILELVPSQSISGVTTVEGINYYFGNSFREGSANVYIVPHFMLNDSSSIQGQSTFQLTTSPTSGSVSVFEKDLGGKISFNEFMNGKIALDTTQWMNKNFFGRGTLGDVRYSTSQTIGSGTDYNVLEYKNLIIDSGSIITTSSDCKGLIVYVKENCIINGELTMTGKSPIGIPNLVDGFIFSKNVNDDEFVETGSLLNPNFILNVERLYQPYRQSPSSSRFDISPNYSVPNQNADLSAGRMCGGGSTSNGNDAGPSTTFGGGVGAGFPSTPGGHGGGILYLIVGKNLIVSSTGKITSRGAIGAAQLPSGFAGSGGGGCVTILYGSNFINQGSILVDSMSSGTPVGGSGSARISKILTF